MIVCITHVKVGHRQTPYKVKDPAQKAGSFALGFDNDLLERSDNAPHSGSLRRTLICAASYVGTKVGHRQTPYKQQSPPREGFVVINYYNLTT